MALISKGSSFYEMNQFDSAYSYFRKCMNVENKHIRAGACYDLAQMFNKIERHDSAYWYLNIYENIRDTIDKERRSDAVMDAKKVYQYNRLQTENISLRERNQIHTQFIFLMALLILILLTCISFFGWLVFRRIQMQAREKKELLRKQDIKKVQQEMKLSDQLRKEARLREDFYKRLNVLSLPNLSGNNYRLTDSDWEQIQKNADIVFDNFTVRLEEKFPLLNKNDIRLCCLIKMGFDLGTISEILSISRTSVSRQKIRIRSEKMGLLAGKSLDKVLYDF